MSDTDGFIEEVNEEVRRDRLFALMRRYGWIAVLAVVLLVGGAAFSEYRKAQTKAAAETLGDAMLAALSSDESAARAEALAGIAPQSASAAAVVNFLAATEQAEAGQTETAIETLGQIAIDGDVPEIYRQIAQFKSITLQGTDSPAAERRLALEALAQAGNPLRLLAEEQMALIEIEENQPQFAIERYRSLLADAEATPDLQQRALQVIVALGGDPEMGAAMQGAVDGTTETSETDTN